MSERPLQPPLLCVVTGMEHSGTTFLSKLLTAHPRVNAAFECGILLGDSPADIPTLAPWSDWFTTPIEEGHWGLSPTHLETVAQQGSWFDAYRKLIAFCPLFREGEDLIVDKSPRYLQDLPDILAKVPGTPCLVLEKDALLTWHSYKRRGFPLKRFADYFNLCHAVLREAEARYPVRRVSQARLSGEKEAVYEELCGWLGLDFDPLHITRHWCKHHLYGISFIWLFKKPYDVENAMAKAAAETSREEVDYLRAHLERDGEDDDTVFRALDAAGR